jgi:hypothetical protein
MSLVKVIELISEGSTIEQAAESAVEEAAKTVRNIKSVYISDIQAIINQNKISKYRIDVKVSFVVDH